MATSWASASSVSFNNLLSASRRAMDTQLTKFPYDIRDVDATTNAQLMEYFTGERTGFVQVGPEGYFFPYKYKSEAENYYNFEARSDDIWITTVPRSGTTWTQELVWLLANELDFQQAQEFPLIERFPFFEFPLFIHNDVKAELLTENKDSAAALEFIELISRSGYETLAELPTNRRRFIKTHFPFSLLPPSVLEKKCKIIYVTRNPKDVAVSYYHLNRLFRTQGYTGDFERYWRYFQQGLNPWLPYYSHVKEAEQYAQLPNVLCLNYEDMVANLPETILKVGNFLNCTPDADGLERLVNHLSFKNFRNNKSVNMHQMEAIGVLNKGEAGFVRNGGQDKAITQLDQKEFVDNPYLLSMANNWIQQNIDCTKTM